MDRMHFDKIVSIIDKPDILVDVGVATNYTEAWWLKEKWNDIPIVGYEPCVSRHNALVNYPGMLHKAAVTNQQGSFRGFMNTYDFKVAAEENKKDPYQTCVVESTTLDYIDNLYGNFKKMFVWADIEGGELNMIKGATNLLKEKRIIAINLELWPKPPVANWPTPEDIVEYLEKFDYYPAFGESGSFADWSRESQEDFVFFPRKENEDAYSGE